MSKELPYFKFYVNEWITGDITIESFQVQGVFISVCAYYWSKDCDVKYDTLKKKFRGNEEDLKTLIDSNIIKILNESVVINFLDEQLTEFKVKSLKNSENGKLGGRPKKLTESEIKPNAFDSLNENKANVKPLRGEERKEDKNREELFLSRKKTFASTLEPFVDLYGKEMLNDFYKYWTEPNKSQTKFKQEMEKTWSLERRLETWAKNDFNKSEPSVNNKPQIFSKKGLRL